MEGVITIVLLILYILLTLYGWQIRGELKKTEYWKRLPSGTALYGYCLPVVLFILLSKEHVGFGRKFLCILLVAFFIYCVYVLSNSLNEKPLEGYSSVLPVDARKKVVLFNALTPLLTISVLFCIGLILDFIFGMSDYIKNEKKGKK